LEPNTRRRERGGGGYLILQRAMGGRRAINKTGRGCMGRVEEGVCWEFEGNKI